MRIPARPFASWRRLAAAGGILALTAAGAAAMWSGLPSRPIEWNDLNGRLALGQVGADTAAEAPRTANNWLATPPAYGRRADTSWLQQVSPSRSEGLPAPKGPSASRGGANWWGSTRQSQLSSTSGKSGLGGVGKGGGGLGSGGGAAVANAGKKSGATVPAGPRAARAGGNSGSNRGSSGGGAGFSSQDTSVGDLVSGAVVTEPGAGLDLGGGGSMGGGDPMAPNPEPASVLLIGTGLLGVAGMLRKRFQ